MSAFRKMVEAVWPRPPAQSQADDAGARVARLSEQIALESEFTVPVLLQELKEAFEAEQGRSERADAKATSLLAALSISSSLAAGILLAALRAEFTSSEMKQLTALAIVPMAIAQFYLVCGALEVLRALKPSTYDVVAPEDLLGDTPAEGVVLVQRRAAGIYGSCGIRNRVRTNLKLDAVHRAQLFVRNAVVSLVIPVAGAAVLVWLTPVREHPATLRSALSCPSCPPALVSVAAPCALPTNSAALPTLPATLP